MKSVRIFVVLLALSCCAAPLPEPVMEAPIVVEEPHKNKPTACADIEPGTDDGIGGTGCP